MYFLWIGLEPISTSCPYNKDDESFVDVYAKALPNWAIIRILY